jgi:hypothetical protein
VTNILSELKGVHARPSHLASATFRISGLESFLIGAGFSAWETAVLQPNQISALLSES